MALPQARPGVHRWWIDRLRMTVIAAVIAVHASTAYVVPVPWYYQEPTTSAVTPVVIGLPVRLLAAFGLAPLFLVGGLLAATSLARRGPGGFARARLLRLGVPILIYVALVDPLLRRWVVRTDGVSGSAASASTDVAATPGFGPLWFVVALLGFSLVYTGVRWLRPAGPRPGRPMARRHLLLLAAGIAAADLLTWPLLPDTVGRYWNFDWPHWQPAAGVFVLGVLAGERGWFRAPPARLVRWCGRSALVAGTVLVGLAALFVDADAGATLRLAPDSWGRTLMAALDGFTAVVLMTWLAVRLPAHWDTAPSAVAAAAARGSYGAYLLHPVVLVGLSLSLRAAPWPPEAKLAIVIAVGVPASFLAGYLATRIAGVGRVI